MVQVNFKLLGKRIAVRRRQLGFKQNQIAEMLGISNNYLSNIENGRSIPSLEVFSKLCEVLQVTPDFLLLGNIKANNIQKNIKDLLLLCSDDTLNLAKEILECLIKNQKNKS